MGLYQFNPNIQISCVKTYPNQVSNEPNMDKSCHPLVGVIF